MKGDENPGPGEARLTGFASEKTPSPGGRLPGAPSQPLRAAGAAAFVVLSEGRDEQGPASPGPVSPGPARPFSNRPPLPSPSHPEAEVRPTQTNPAGFLLKVKATQGRKDRLSANGAGGTGPIEKQNPKQTSVSASHLFKDELKIDDGLNVNLKP